MTLSIEIVFETEKDFLEKLIEVQKFCLKQIEFIQISSITKNINFTAISIDFQFYLNDDNLDFEIIQSKIENEILELFELSNDYCLYDFEI